MITLDYLLPELRLELGDTNPSTYRYLDEWLLIALNTALRLSYRYLGNKYIINDANEVTRNPNIVFEFPEEEGLIQKKDEPVIVLLAALLVLEGSLENSAWDVGSWKDAEISFSNIESGRLRDAGIARRYNRLHDLVLPPTKRLGKAQKNSLSGYIGNTRERSGNH